MYVVKLCPKKVSLVFDSCQFYTFLGYRLSMTTTEIIFSLKLFALQSLKKDTFWFHVILEKSKQNCFGTKTFKKNYQLVHWAHLTQF